MAPAWDFDSLKGVSVTMAAGTAVGLWAAYRIGLAVYNISPFHPLARFPGPKLAAASYACEAYYDWILVGRYGREIAKMHEKYGWSPPVVFVEGVAY